MLWQTVTRADRFLRQFNHENIGYGENVREMWKNGLSDRGIKMSRQGN